LSTPSRCRRPSADGPAPSPAIRAGRVVTQSHADGLAADHPLTRPQQGHPPRTSTAVCARPYPMRSRWRCSRGASTGDRWYRSVEEAMKAAGRHRERCAGLNVADTAQTERAVRFCRDVLVTDCRRADPRPPQRSRADRTPGRAVWHTASPASSSPAARRAAPTPDLGLLATRPPVAAAHDR
jgi:hypothetical protein